MKRKIAAVLAFNIYALTFVSSFWAATPFLFHADEIDSIRDRGLHFDYGDWGFGDHYLWRFVAAVISTAFSGFICGAIARQRGGRVALLANVPSVIGWIAYAWMCFYLFDDLATKAGDKPAGLWTSYGVMSVIAIPTTCWLAIKSGEIGERFQTEFFQHAGTLGIADWNWAWLWLAISPYGYPLVVSATGFLRWQLRMWSDRSFQGALLSLLGIIIVAAWIAPLVIAYQTLAGSRFADRSPLQRGAMSISILLVGYLVGMASMYILGGGVLQRFGY